MNDRLEQFKKEVTPEMLKAGVAEIACAIPEHEMWDEDDLVLNCWAAMRLAASGEARETGE